MDTVSYPSGSAGDSQEAAATEFQFRPLTTGQILDRSFALYRSHFWLFAGFAVFPAAVSLLFGLARVGYLLATHQPLVARGLGTRAAYTTTGLSLFGFLLSMCVYGISIAATTWCIAAIYQGNAATMRSGFEFAFRRWLRYILLVLCVFISALWLPFLAGAALTAGVFAVPGLKGSASAFIGFALFVGFAAIVVWTVIRFLRVSLAIPACVVEELSIWASIRRSKVLLVSRKGRIFLLFLFLYVLELVFFAVLIPISALLAHKGPTGFLIIQLSTLTLTFLYGVLISPVYAVGLCLFYFDERVRREGFDIEFLMRKSEEASATTATELPAES